MLKIDFGWERLSSWLGETTGLDLSDRQKSALESYVDTLLVWNQKIGLISRNDTERVVSRHIADGLFAAAHCGDGEAIVDLGSGAGFPGIPIAVVRSASRVCLIESKSKKASFLGEAVRVTRATNVTVCHERIEAAAREARHQFHYQVAIARALTSSEAFFETAASFLVPGGRAIAMKSASQMLESSAPGARHIEYRLPDGSERLLAIVERR